METSKSELWEMLTTMTRMRRLELSADQLYKTKLARGFLHLADGQVPVVNSACMLVPGTQQQKAPKGTLQKC